MALGLFVSAYSYTLKLGTLMSPGPGMMPFVFGIALLLCAVPMFISAQMALRRRRDPGPSPWTDIQYRRILLVLVALAGYAVCLEWAGFLLSAFLLLIVLFRLVDTEKWSTALLAAVLTVAAAFVVFVLVLKVELPAGITGRIW
jgi:putative tricarboxylic transport membrane protein